jgi:hypothetical protein
MHINFLTFVQTFLSKRLMHKEIQNVCYLMDWDMFILGLRLLFLTNVPGATSITRAKSIPDSRVVILGLAPYTERV